MVNRIPALDTLRSLAVLWVIGHHIAWPFGLLAIHPLLARVLLSGNSGVDLFFVLSGYLITALILRDVRSGRGIPVYSFWRRRWLRTLPAYYATLTVIALSDWVVPPIQPWQPFLPYVVFLQNYATAMPRFGWSWSLCVEEQFYLVLPLAFLALCRLCRRWSPERALRWLALGAFVVSNIARYLAYEQIQTQGAAWSAYGALVLGKTHFWMEGLAVGMFLATLPKSKAGASLATTAALALGVLAWFIVTDLPELVVLHRCTLLALIFGTFVYASVGENRWATWRVPGTRFIADLSYSLYLTHPIALRVVQRMLPTRNPVWQLVAFAVLTLAASVALRYGVEVPFLNWRDRSQRALREHGRHAVAPNPGENRSTPDALSPNSPQAVRC